MFDLDLFQRARSEDRNSERNEFLLEGNEKENPYFDTRVKT